MTIIKLFDANELSPDEARQVEIEGRAPVAVYNVDGQFFATDDTCTHGEASLAEGEINGGEIICPFHMGAFDIRTGEATVGPCEKALRTYPVRIENGSVYLEIDQ